MKRQILFLALVSLPLAAAAAEPVRAVVGDDGVQRVEITGSSYRFEPAHVVVQVGKPVELVLRRGRGMAPHDFDIDVPDAGITVHEELGREPHTVRFTPQATGRFEFACTKNLPLLRSHRERGMHGILEVVD